MKNTITLFVFLIIFAQGALADSQGFFTNNLATVMVQGQPGDTDAVTLFGAMTSAITEDASFRYKAFSYTNQTGSKVLDITCKISKAVSNYGSCTVALYASQWTSIGTASAFLHLDRTQDSNLAGQGFVSPDSTGKIFGTRNEKLSIRLDSDESNFKAFSITYVQ